MAVRLHWSRVAVSSTCIALSFGLLGYALLGGAGLGVKSPSISAGSASARIVSQDQIDIIEAAVVHSRFSSRLEGNASGKQARSNLSLLLEDETVTVCRDARAEDSCESMLDDRLLEWEGIDSRIDVDLRLRLASANRAPGKHPAIAKGLLRPVESRDIARLFAGSTDGWSKFHQAYPDSAGVVKATVPVLSRSGMWALVYVEHSCGWRCGSGHLFLLMRSREGWQVVVSDGVMMV